MKKQVWLFFAAFSFSALGAAVLAVLLTGRIPLWGEKPWPGVILGAVMICAAIPFHIAGKKKSTSYLVSCLFNTVSTGLFISSYFTYAQKQLRAADFVLPLLLTAALSALRCAFARSEKTAKLTDSILLGVNFVAAAASLVLWIIHGGVFYPLLWFLLVPEFMLGLFLPSYLAEKGSPLRWISFASYSYALVIGLVVVLILTEGELLDGLFDGIDLPFGKKARAEKDIPVK